MSEQQFLQFQQRKARVRAGHARGLGHEAAGSLGRSAYRREGEGGGAWRAWGARLICVTLLGVALKSAISAQQGPDLYAYRIQNLQEGGALDRLTAFLLQPDPVSSALAYGLVRYL